MHPITVRIQLWPGADGKPVLRTYRDMSYVDPRDGINKNLDVCRIQVYITSMQRKSKQPPLKYHGHGGARKGAGRKKNPNSGVPHIKRPSIQEKHPMHITVRLSDGVVSLRSAETFRIFQNSVKASQRFGLRVLQYAVLGNHFHLLVEAPDLQSLTRAMKCLNVRLALGLKRLKRLSQPVLKHRFDLKILKTPTQVRNALVYVLANACKHFKRRQVYDKFSSYGVFNDVQTLKRARRDLDWKLPPIPASQKKLINDLISVPESWLASSGWRRARA